MCLATARASSANGTKGAEARCMHQRGAKFISWLTTDMPARHYSSCVLLVHACRECC